jgi:hypothetical protein
VTKLLTGSTDFPLGVSKRILFKIHGAVELVAGVLLIVAPWVFWLFRGLAFALDV